MILVVELIGIHIIYRFGIPETIMTDNNQPFKRLALCKLYAKYQIKENHSSRYYTLANGLAKAFNVTICMMPKKMVDKNKRLSQMLLEPYRLIES